MSTSSDIYRFLDRGLSVLGISGMDAKRNSRGLFLLSFDFTSFGHTYYDFIDTQQSPVQIQTSN